MRHILKLISEVLGMCGGVYMWLLSSYTEAWIFVNFMLVLLDMSATICFKWNKSLWIFIYLFIHLFTYLFIDWLIDWLIYLLIYLFIYLFTYLFIYLFIFEKLLLSDQRTWVDGNEFGYMKDVSCDFPVVLKLYGMECNFCQHIHREIFIFFSQSGKVLG